MSTLLGADTRRVDLIAEGLRGHSRDIQDLRSMAERAVAAIRGSWAGPDFESIAQPWEQQAGPRLTDVATALATMAGALRAQAQEQRQTSGPLGAVTIGTTNGDHTDAGSSTFINGREVGAVGSLTFDMWGRGGLEPTPGGGVADTAKLTLAQGDRELAGSLASLAGGEGGSRYELSVGKVEAAADYSASLDAHGDLVASAGASAGASAAAYAGYAAGTIRGGSDVANGTVGGTAYVGAQVRADSSGSIGPGGAMGHLGAEAFAGAKAEAEVGGTVAGLGAAAGAEISYGIGAHAEIDAELSVTKVGVLVDVGATLGVGAGVTFEVSVNPREAIASVDHVVDEVREAAQDVGEGLAFARDHVEGLIDWK